MNTWEFAIEPSGIEVSIEHNQILKPDLNDIKRTMETIQPIPQVALKIMRIMRDGSYDIQVISEEVKKDQVISAKTLQLCNSAMFTKRQHIESLDHALVFLGRNLLLKLVISAALQSYFDQCGQGYSLCKGGIYHHAIGCGMVAEQIAILTEKEDPSIAYTAGLIHDIGKVVLDQYISTVYPLMYREFHENGRDVLEAERHILGTDHTKIGGILAAKWLLPESLADVILFHHNPVDATSNSELVTIVYLANILLSRFHTGMEIELMNIKALNSGLDLMGFSMQDFEVLIDLIPNTVFNLTMELNENGRDKKTVAEEDPGR